MNSKTVVVRTGSAEELLAAKAAAIATSNERLSILAGHFLLIYQHESRKLLPLIRGEFSDMDTEEPLLILARDFPEMTFTKGLDLLLSIGENKGRILLLVDDESVRFLQKLPDEVKLSELRRAFFHQSLGPPLSLSREIAQRHLSPLDVLEPNSIRRASSILPSNSWLFSEHILRVRFRRKIRKKLSEMEGFRFREDPLTTSLFFERTENTDSSCLVEGGGEETCSGTALALMDILRARAYRHFVWFLPSGCKESVTRAVVLAVRELEWFSSALLVYETAIPGEANTQFREALLVGEA